MGRPSNKRAWAAVNDQRPRVFKGVEFLLVRIFGVEKVVAGVPVLVLETGNDAASSRVGRALHLIRAHDPIRFERLRSDLTGGVQGTEFKGGTAWFDAATWTCHLDASHLEAHVPIEQMAMSIVHEAAHARLWRNGFEYDAELRYRVELICMRRELAFARRLPKSAELIEECEERLDWLTPDYLTDEGFAQRASATRIRLLRTLLDTGCPPWSIRVMLSVAVALTGRFWQQKWLSSKDRLRPASEAASMRASKRRVQ